MNSLNLVEDITNTQHNKSNVYIENEKDSSYIRYLELLDIYFSESCKPKFNNKFNYYVDNDGNYVKESLDKSDKDSMVIIKPKYIDITDRLIELDKTIKDMETTLRQYRTGLLNNDLSIKESFDKLYKMYTEIINERDSIIEYNNKANNFDTNKELKLKLKLDNINVNLTQYTLFNSIKLFYEEEDIRKYLLNNELVNSNINKVNNLNITSSKLKSPNFIVKEIFNNNLPTKTKIIKKKKKFKLKPPTVEEPTVEEVAVEEPTVEKVAVKEPTVEEPTVEEVAVKEPTVEEVAVKEPTVEEVAVKEPTVEEVEEMDSQVKEETTEYDDDELYLEEVDLSKDVGDQYDDSELKLDLKSLFNEDDEDDESSDDAYVFNKDKVPPKDTDEDGDIQLNLEADVEQTNSSNLGEDEEIDLAKLSRKLNKKANENVKVIKVDSNLQFSNIKCDDSKTTRSGIKTTNIADGKKRRKKDMDPELKNCMLPFKEIKGKGKKKKEIIHEECTDTGIEDWCATERNEDCTTKKWAYCNK